MTEVINKVIAVVNASSTFMAGVIPNPAKATNNNPTRFGTTALALCNKN